MDLIIGKAAGRDFHINAQELVTGRTCIIAQSGAGKSWSIAVLCEQLCQHQIGFCLIDTEGEYFSLKDKFDITWVGIDEECDEDIEKVNIKALMSDAVRESKAIIFDVSEVDMYERVTKLAHVLYDVATEERKPYLLIVEEADKFIPQSKDSIKKIEEISRRGRKRGLGMLVATQRPAIVTKNVLSQCNNQIIGKLSIENDLKAVGLFFSSKAEVDELTTLQPGDFFVMGGLTREKTKMRFGKRLTKHRGLTPILGDRTSLDIKADPEEVNAVEGDAKDSEASEPSGTAPAEKPASKPKAKPKPKSQPKPRKKPAPAKIPAAREAGDKKAVVCVFGREEILSIAQKKVKKKVLGFGEEERITEVHQSYRPLVLFEVRYISGKLRRTTKVTRFMVEGMTGSCASVKNGLSLRPCFNDLLGLEEDEVRVATTLPLSGLTLPELEGYTRMDERAVADAVEGLEEKKRVTIKGEVGGSPVYVPLLSHAIPQLGDRQVSVDLKTEPYSAPARQMAVHEFDIRMILKVLEPTAEITATEVIWYPVYDVTLATLAGERTVFIDGVTGREVDGL